MSYLVCGKRSFTEDLPSPYVSKRSRCSSPIRISPSMHASGTNVALTHPSSLLFDQLTALFPSIDNKVVAQALEACGDNLDLAIKNLNGLQNAQQENTTLKEENQVLRNENSRVVAFAQNAQQENTTLKEENQVLRNENSRVVAIAQNAQQENTTLKEENQVLRNENSILVAIAQNAQQENTTLKEQNQALSNENSILKRAVAIQHERQKNVDGNVQELQYLKEQVRMLEVKNYALSMHLKQAQQSNTIPGRFHPDIF